MSRIRNRSTEHLLCMCFQTSVTENHRLEGLKTTEIYFHISGHWEVQVQGERVPWVLFLRALIPFMRPPNDPITYQGPHLLILSQWGLSFNIRIWGEESQTFSSLHIGLGWGENIREKVRNYGSDMTFYYPLFLPHQILKIWIYKLPSALWRERIRTWKVRTSVSWGPWYKEELGD